MYPTKLQPHSDPLTLSRAEEILRRLCATNTFREALAIDEELRRLRTAVEYLLDHATDEYDRGFEEGRLAGEGDAKGNLLTWLSTELTNKRAGEETRAFIAGVLDELR